MTAHYHVGSNVPGYLPENDLYCIDDLIDAARAMQQEIAKLGEDTREGCDRDGCGYCDWCIKARLISREASGDAVTLFATELDVEVNAYRTFDIPCNPGGIAVWAATIETDRAGCEHNMDRV